MGDGTQELEPGGEAYDAAKQAEALALAKEKIEEPLDAVEGADGKTYQFTPLDQMGRVMRRVAVQILQLKDTEGYEKYRALKYSAGDNPDLKTRMKAYAYALKRALELSYRMPGF